MVIALNKGDTKFIQKNSAAEVGCYCGTDSVTDEITVWKPDKFAPQFIKKYNSSPKLKQVIETENPEIILSPVNESKPQKVFSVVYLVDKPAADYEGTSIFFDILKKGNVLKLTGIWTIP